MIKSKLNNYKRFDYRYLGNNNMENLIKDYIYEQSNGKLEFPRDVKSNIFFIHCKEFNDYNAFTNVDLLPFKIVYKIVQICRYVEALYPDQINTWEYSYAK